MNVNQQNAAVIAASLDQYGLPDDFATGFLPMQNMLWAWKQTAPFEACVGYVPTMVNNVDTDAVKQLHENYAHGGGWVPFRSFRVEKDRTGHYTLNYPDDPPYVQIAQGWLPATKQLVVMFPSAWVMVVDKAENGETYRIARMD